MRQANVHVDGCALRPEPGAPVTRRWLLYVENLTDAPLALATQALPPTGIGVEWVTAIPPNRAGEPTLIASASVDGPDGGKPGALAAVYRRDDGTTIDVQWSLASDAAPALAIAGDGVATLVWASTTPETLRAAIGVVTGATMVLEEAAAEPDLAKRGARRPMYGPDYSDDSFVVTIANNLTTALNPATSTSTYTASKFDWGHYVSGTGAGSIGAGKSATAFSVEGASGWPSGVQGYITYNVSASVYLVIQFNSNCCNDPGDYFYAEMVPKAPNADATTAYAQMTGFAFWNDDASAFTPTITVSPTTTLDITPLVPPATIPGGGVLSVSIANELTDIMTFGALTSPLNSGLFQPAVGYVIPTGNVPTLACYALNNTPLAGGTTTSTLTLAYNLDNGVVMTLDMPFAFKESTNGNYEAGATPTVSFQGDDAGLYQTSPALVTATVSDFGQFPNNGIEVAVVFSVVSSDSARRK